MNEFTAQVLNANYQAALQAARIGYSIIVAIMVLVLILSRNGAIGFYKKASSYMIFCLIIFGLIALIDPTLSKSSLAAAGLISLVALVAGYIVTLIAAIKAKRFMCTLSAILLPIAVAVMAIWSTSI